MSGVYIPGIEIPTEKPIAILLCTDRSVGLYDVVARQLRHIRECEPAIPVHDHGRLIDADVLEADVQGLWLQNEISNGDWIGFRETLNRIPTIITADKEASP